MQDSLPAALCTKPGGGELLDADEPQRLRHVDDGDTGERQQVLAIPGDDQIGLCGHRGGNELIVIDIARHDPRHAGRRDQFNDLDVVGEHRGCGLIDEG
jgi:hypothetical protein